MPRRFALRVQCRDAIEDGEVFERAVVRESQEEVGLAMINTACTVALGAAHVVDTDDLAELHR
ncbi:hypothetical protein [Streptomyces sp. NPDC056844]|uniref:hypothetical protein n=1 Tax=unclassified Streptomyces TaxID=2593676 RepID=UPI003678A569